MSKTGAKMVRSGTDPVLFGSADDCSRRMGVCREPAGTTLPKPFGVAGDPQRQHGSIVWGLIVLIAIGGAIYFYGWDRISYMLDSALGSAPIELEVTDFACDVSDPSFAKGRGSVKNISEDSLSLTAVVVWRVEGMKPNPVHARVKPSPLSPGAVGRFSSRPTALPRTSGQCRLARFRDKQGRQLEYAVDCGSKTRQTVGGDVTCL